MIMESVPDLPDDLDQGPEFCQKAEEGPESFPTDRSGLRIYLHYDALPVDVPIGLLCTIDGLKQAQVVGGISQRILLLRDAHSEEFESAPVQNAPIVDRARIAFDRGLQVVVYGILSCPPKKKYARAEPTARLHIHDIAKVPHPSVLLGAADDEVAQTDALIDHLSRVPDALRQHIIDEINFLTNTSIAGQSMRFATAQLMVILQALSFGMVPTDTNDRISTLFFGSSGSGKKKLSTQAITLAMVSGQAQPGNITLAGLTAAVSQRAGRGWRSTPGKLPRANLGVFVHEDLHRTEARDLKVYQGVYLGVAEEGRMCPTKAVASNFTCRVALHLNANRQSILDPKKDLSDPQARAQDIVMGYDLLTRMDGMIDLTSGDNASESAVDIALCDEAKTAATEDPFSVEDRQRTRAVKLLIARLWDRIPHVTTKEVEPEIRKLCQDVALLTREYTSQVTGPQQETFNADSLLRRMSNSIRKFIGASARLNGRSVAAPADVECAWDMLSLKLEVIKYICGQSPRIRSQGSRERQVKQALRLKQQRWDTILQHFGGSVDSSAEEIADFMELSLKTVYQELRERALLPTKGRYCIPTWDQYEEMTRNGPKLDPLMQATILHPEDEEPEELEEELEEVEEEAVFVDCLPETAPAVVPFLDAIEEMAEDEDGKKRREQVTDMLFDLALKEDGNSRGHGNHQMTVASLWQSVANSYDRRHEEDEEGKIIPSATYQEVLGKLWNTPWIERGTYAMAVYVDSDLPDCHWVLEKRLAEEGDRLPPELREAVTATLTRLAFYRERDMAQVLAEKEATKPKDPWAGLRGPVVPGQMMPALWAG